MEEIPVCMTYRIRGKLVSEMPATADGVKAIEPQYETRPGWRAPTAGITRYEDLPQLARDYIEFLEERVGVEIGCISTGPERDQTIFRPGSRLDTLLRR
jgi:adenylosuccinate synthase